MYEMRLKALAKINLGLDVLRRREDGYHEVCMVMQTLSLYDRIIIKKLEKQEIQVKCQKMKIIWSIRLHRF